MNEEKKRRREPTVHIFYQHNIISNYFDVLGSQGDKALATKTTKLDNAKPCVLNIIIIFFFYKFVAISLSVNNKKC